MKSFTINLRDLSVLTGRDLTAQDLPAGKLEGLVRAEFGFLPNSVRIQVAGDLITVSFPDEPEADQSEATRLCDRAGKRAAKGEYAKAIPTSYLNTPHAEAQRTQRRIREAGFPISVIFPSQSRESC